MVSRSCCNGSTAPAATVKALRAGGTRGDREPSPLRAVRPPGLLRRRAAGDGPVGTNGTAPAADGQQADPLAEQPGAGRGEHGGGALPGAAGGGRHGAAGPGARLGLVQLRRVAELAGGRAIGGGAGSVHLLATRPVARRPVALAAARRPP